MAQRRIDSFFCQQTSSVRGAFSWFEASVLLKTPMFSQWLLLVSFIQNHSAITQLFYVTTSSSLKPIVHDLLYSEMVRERNSSPIELKSMSKIFPRFAAVRNQEASARGRLINHKCCSNLIWCHNQCPLQRGCPLVGGSVMGGSTVYSGVGTCWEIGGTELGLAGSPRQAACSQLTNSVQRCLLQRTNRKPHLSFMQEFNIGRGP